MESSKRTISASGELELLQILTFTLNVTLLFILRLAKKQASSIKKAVVDLWQLAFSYQVNPLAMAQPLSGL